MDANSPEISRNSNEESIFLLLKRLNKGNTLIEGCLSTIDVDESIFQWTRGNRGWRQDMRRVDANCARDQRADYRLPDERLAHAR